MYSIVQEWTKSTVSKRVIQPKNTRKYLVEFDWGGGEFRVRGGVCLEEMVELTGADYNVIMTLFLLFVPYIDKITRSAIHIIVF